MKVARHGAAHESYHRPIFLVRRTIARRKSSRHESPASAGRLKLSRPAQSGTPIVGGSFPGTYPLGTPRGTCRAILIRPFGTVSFCYQRSVWTSSGIAEF